MVVFAATLVRFTRSAALAAGLALPGIASATWTVTPARAEVSIPNDRSGIDEAFSRFDPTAVAAARHYASNPQIRAAVVAMIHGMEPVLIKQAEQRSGKSLSDSVKSKITGAVEGALADNLDVLLEVNALVLLQVMTKDEVIALDTFYSSPMGQRIMTKMPQVLSYSGRIMQMFYPRFTAALMARMKAIDPM